MFLHPILYTSAHSFIFVTDYKLGDEVIALLYNKNYSAWN